MLKKINTILILIVIYFIRSLSDPLILTDNESRLLIKDNEKTKYLSYFPNSATYYSLFEQMGFIGFKDFQKKNEKPLQLLYVYDIKKEDKKLIEGPSDFVSLPAISSKYIAYFLNDTLMIINHSKELIFRKKIGYLANQLVFHPKNNRILSWFDFAGNLVLYNWKEDEFISVPEESMKEGYSITWSLQGDYRAISTVDGYIEIYGDESNEKFAEFQGFHPIWKGDACIEYIEIDYSLNFQPIKSRLIERNIKSKQKRIILEFSDPIIVKRTKNLRGHFLYYDITGRVYQIDKNKLLEEMKIEENNQSSKEMKYYDFNRENDDSQVVIPGFESIYFHQVYDIKDGVSNIGHGCCGAASTLMGLIYYDVLEPWPVICSNPYKHESQYGYYITEKYRLNGTVFDVSYRGGEGIYGWIYRNSLEDTKGHMRDLIRKHGISSNSDWSPTYSKLMSEADNHNPSVVLNSITSSGHYILAVGYVPDKKIGIFNDPYGNKNTPGYPSYDGIHVRYDWPGWNNGYRNLNTVWMYNYMRPGLDVCADANYYYTTDSLYLNYQIKNAGTLDLESPITATASLFMDDSLVYEWNLEKNTMSPFECFDSMLVFPLNGICGEGKTTRFNVSIEGLADVSEIYKNNNHIEIPLEFKTDSILPLSQSPEDGEVIVGDEVYIKVKFSSENEINPKNTKLWVDSVDYSEDAFFSNTYVRMKVSGLSAGEHTAKIELSTDYGFLQYYTWTFVINPTSIEEQNLNEELKSIAYPNPVSSSLFYNAVGKNDGIKDILIYNILGNKVQELRFPINTYQTEISFSQFPAGIYFIKTVFYNGITENRKITVLH